MLTCYMHVHIFYRASCVSAERGISIGSTYFIEENKLTFSGDVPCSGATFNQLLFVEKSDQNLLGRGRLTRILSSVRAELRNEFWWPRSCFRSTEITIKKGCLSIFTSNESRVCADRTMQETAHWEKMAHNWPGKRADFFRRNGKLCASARAVVCLAMSVAAPRGARFLAVRRRLHIVPLEHTHTDLYSWFLIFMALCFLGNFWSKHTSARRKGKVSRV